MKPTFCINPSINQHITLPISHIRTPDTIAIAAIDPHFQNIASASETGSPLFRPNGTPYSWYFHRTTVDLLMRLKHHISLTSIKLQNSGPSSPAAAFTISLNCCFFFLADNDANDAATISILLVNSSSQRLRQRMLIWCWLEIDGTPAMLVQWQTRKFNESFIRYGMWIVSASPVSVGFITMTLVYSSSIEWHGSTYYKLKGTWVLTPPSHHSHRAGGFVFRWSSL